MSDDKNYEAKKAMSKANQIMQALADADAKFDARQAQGLPPPPAHAQFTGYGVPGDLEDDPAPAHGPFTGYGAQNQYRTGPTPAPTPGPAHGQFPFVPGYNTQSQPQTEPAPAYESVHSSPASGYSNTQLPHHQTSLAPSNLTHLPSASATTGYDRQQAHLPPDTDTNTNTDTDPVAPSSVPASQPAPKRSSTPKCSSTPERHEHARAPRARRQRPRQEEGTLELAAVAAGDQRVL